MSITIPRATDYVVERGDHSIVVFALQRTLNKVGIPTAEDMDFGPATEASAKKLQTRIGVTPDGKFGPISQAALGRWLCARQERASGTLPDLLLWSKVRYESGGFLGAVNWSVAGGVDCGMTQRRVYDEQYDEDAVIKRAFDPVYQLDLSGDRIVELHSIFLPRPGVRAEPSQRRSEFSYRLAVLNHNYPAGATKISEVGIRGLSSYWHTPQSWVTIHKLTFPDGAPVRTPLEWCQRYALGSSAHDEPGQAVKLVQTWN